MTTYGEAVVGKSVWVEWRVGASKNAWYEGVIKSFDSNSGEHELFYEHDKAKVMTDLGEQEDEGLLQWTAPPEFAAATAKKKPSRKNKSARPASSGDDDDDEDEAPKAKKPAKKATKKAATPRAAQPEDSHMEEAAEAEAAEAEAAAAGGKRPSRAAKQKAMVTSRRVAAADDRESDFFDSDDSEAEPRAPSRKKAATGKPEAAPRAKGKRRARDVSEDDDESFLAAMSESGGDEDESSDYDEGGSTAAKRGKAGKGRGKSGGAGGSRGGASKPKSEYGNKPVGVSFRKPQVKKGAVRKRPPKQPPQPFVDPAGLDIEDRGVEWIVEAQCEKLMPLIEEAHAHGEFKGGGAHSLCMERPAYALHAETLCMHTLCMCIRLASCSYPYIPCPLLSSPLLSPQVSRWRRRAQARTPRSWRCGWCRRCWMRVASHSTSATSCPVSSSPTSSPSSRATIPASCSSPTSARSAPRKRE